MGKRQFLMVVVGIATLVAVMSCSIAPTVVLYKVSGTALTVDVTYENSSGGTSQVSGVSLPWQYQFSVTGSAYHFLYVSAQNSGSSGSVTSEIYVDGKVDKSSTSSGAYVIATSSSSLGSY